MYFFLLDIKMGSRRWFEDAMRCDKPVTVVVCSRYEKREERP